MLMHKHIEYRYTMEKMENKCMYVSSNDLQFIQLSIFVLEAQNVDGQ